MVKIYGRDAILVTDPNGAESPYEIREVPPTNGAHQAWEVVKADGTTHIVKQWRSGF
jgi:hypothetical protein